jgi:hypothetical protein
MQQIADHGFEKTGCLAALYLSAKSARADGFGEDLLHYSFPDLMWEPRRSASPSMSAGPVGAAAMSLQACSC